MAAHDKNTQNT